MKFQILPFLILLSFLCFLGCEKGTLRNAQVALDSNNPAKCAEILDTILKKNPNDFEAARLYVDLHIGRGEFELGEKKLIQLWELGGLGGEKDRSLEERISKKHLQSQFSFLYERWLKEIDDKKNPVLFERVALKGLKQNPNNSALIQKLVQFYLREGDTLVDGNEKIAAAEMFSKILKINALTLQQEDARKRARNLKKEIFRDKAVARFEKKILPSLRKEGRWEPAKRLVTFSFSGKLDRKLNFKKDEDLDSAKQVAHLELRHRISKLLQELAFTEKRVPKNRLPKYKIETETYKKGRYEISTALSFEDVLEASFDLVSLSD